eukprot:NODE_79_length_22985_cov_0.358401.p2 type:complete len:774 gc:universal NODE_79_length_22985_cov_0.358401:4346-2025(-)
MFNIHEKIIDTSTIKSKTNQQILLETQEIRAQKQSVLKIEDFYLMCLNKNFILRMHQIKKLNHQIAKQFWLNANPTNLKVITSNIAIPEQYQLHAFKCGYLLPLTFPKSTVMVNLLNNIFDERRHLMIVQIIHFIWLSDGLFHFLEFCIYLNHSDVKIGSIDLLSFYDLHDLYKSLVMKRIPSELKKSKLQGLFHLCTMLSIDRQHEFALLFTPLLKSLNSISIVILLFDNQSIANVSHYFYKCKPIPLYSSICKLFNAHNPLELANSFKSLNLVLSRQYIFNCYTMIHKYIINTFDYLINQQLDGLIQFAVLSFHLIQYLEHLDYEKEDYDSPIVPLIADVVFTIKCIMNRLNISNDVFSWSSPLFWNPTLKLELSNLNATGSSLRVSGQLGACNELQLLGYNPFYYSFLDRLQMFHIAFPRIDNSNLFVRKNNYIIDRSEMLQYLFAIDFTKPMSIKFIDDGFEEEGIDGGGLYMEFMSLMIKEIYKYYFISFNESLIINLRSAPFKFRTKSGEQERVISIDPHDAMYYIGVVIGRCLRDDIVLPQQLNMLIISLLFDSYTLNDMYYYDMDLYSSLLNLLKTDVNDMNISWTVVVQGREIEISNKMVTNENKLNYVIMASKVIIDQYKPYTYKMITGIQQMIGVIWMDPLELKMMMHGDNKIDANDIINNLVLQGYKAEDATIKHFYYLIGQWDESMLSRFMQFVTGRDRPPVLGCKQLNPLIGILKINEDRMPSSATCMNLLRLPESKTFSELRYKLEYALIETKGFSLG